MTTVPPSPSSSELSPRRALDLVRLLSCDVRGGAVIDGSGALVAGDVLAPDAPVVGAAAGEHEVLVALGPHALLALAEHDVALAAGLLA